MAIGRGRRASDFTGKRNTAIKHLRAMDFQENHIIPRDVLPVVVIGNGPSGICLSYMLSGYVPYLSPEGSHPNPILQSKLQHRPQVSLLDQDLEYLCEGLEGRSSNPVAVLFDSLLLPDSDFGVDYPSPLQWRYEPGRAIPHMVLGKGPPGGAWHAMEGSMLTLSLANWMELPGLKLKDWVREKRRNVRNDRATPAEIASYYQHYVTRMGLQDHFASGSTVTSLQRVGGGGGAERLEDLPFVCHSFWELEAAISAGRLGQSSEPLLVVGAGLTAADAVLAARHLNAPVRHAFRRSVADPALIFNQLPKVLYPEYHKVHQMMTQQQEGGETRDASSSSYPRCVLEGEGGRRTVLRVSMALVLIGSCPNLSFLPANGRPLGLDPGDPISCRRNPLDVDPYSHECAPRARPVRHGPAGGRELRPLPEGRGPGHRGAPGPETQGGGAPRAGRAHVRAGLLIGRCRGRPGTDSVFRWSGPS
ncbi:hypothetical protein SKAU_G00153820 [Synaphobranchus kaupii]|uniref:Oxidative stress induced growth inhibitor 1 n=1 Tax=Synaphobranchus kaupii TaxID=118154 RepID=A0A9Q1FHL8_SYNKA|nr:hypothetical protein SKAU_G00153820 [Synaphobranchus kaupii]